MEYYDEETGRADFSCKSGLLFLKNKRLVHRKTGSPKERFLIVQNPERKAQAKVPQGIRQDRAQKGRGLRIPRSRNRDGAPGPPRTRGRLRDGTGTRGPYLCGSGSKSRSSCNNRAHRLCQPRRPCGPSLSPTLALVLPLPHDLRRSLGHATGWAAVFGLLQAYHTDHGATIQRRHDLSAA